MWTAETRCQDVAKALQSAGLSAKAEFSTLVIGNLRYRFYKRLYGRTLYVDNFRVQQPNSPTAVQRIVNLIVRLMPEKLRQKTEEERVEEYRKKLKKLQLLGEVAGVDIGYRAMSLFSNLDNSRQIATVIACLKRDKSLLPFVAELLDGDDFVVFAMCDFLEEKGEHLDLAEALRKAYGGEEC